jgi:5-methylcytosine-specific restriction protein A
MDRPVVWKMIIEAVNSFNGRATNTEIKNYISEKWNFKNSGTIRNEIQSLSVNDHNRVHYPINFQPRTSDSDSRYDRLFKLNKGEVEFYDIAKHGIWEIYKDQDNNLAVRHCHEVVQKKIFTPTDIVWFKNVTNTEIGEAYLNEINNPFVIHFPTKHKTNVLSPAVNEIILVYQKVNGVPAFTHLVSPVDYQLVTDDTRSDYRYGRRVKIIAKTNSNNFIPVSSTLWERINFSGITQGNACKLENISGIGNIAELQLDIWQRFSEHFISSEREAAEEVRAIINELDLTDPNISVTEGELKLVSHMIKERNRKIVKEKKQQSINAGTLFCEVCSFSFPKNYKSNFIECHHIVPIGQTGVRETTLDDLALVCANCHRMLHTKFEGVFLSIEQLQSRMKLLSQSE